MVELPELNLEGDIFILLVNDSFYERDRIFFIDSEFNSIEWLLETTEIQFGKGNIKDWMLVRDIVYGDFIIYNCLRLQNGFNSATINDWDGKIDSVFDSIIRHYPNDEGDNISLTIFLDQVIGYEVLDINGRLELASCYGMAEQIENLIEQGATEMNQSLYDIARIGNLELIDSFINQHHVTNMQNGLNGAARGGHLDLIQYFLDRGADNYDRALFQACMGGHIDAINRIHEFKITDFSSGLEGSIAGNHFDLVDFYLKYSPDLNEALSYAAFNASSQMILYLIEKGATTDVSNLNRAAINAAKYGKYRNLELLLNLGATNVNSILKISAKFGNLNPVKLALKYGATNTTMAFRKAAKYDHHHIIDYLLEQGFKSKRELNAGLYGAASGDVVDAAKFMIAQGADDIAGANLIARNKDSTETMEFLLNYL